MTRVEVMNGGHQLRIECAGTANSVLKLAVELWNETHCDCGGEPGLPVRSNWLVYPTDVDTGEPG